MVFMRYSQDRYAPLSALQQYMSQVKRAPCFTDEEEALFLRSIRTGENVQLAYARLVEGYQPLVIGLARRFERRCQRMELLDLIQEGNLGLLQALERYDESKGEASFRTFAFSWVRGCMLAAFWQYEGLLRLPLQKVRAIRVMNEVHARLLSALSCEPTIAETARAMEIEERDVRELMVLQEQEVVSLHLPLDEHGETLLEAVIADPAASAFVEDGFSSAEDVLDPNKSKSHKSFL